MSVSVGVAGATEVLYSMPEELRDCFESAEEFNSVNTEWAKYLHKT